MSKIIKLIPYMTEREIEKKNNVEELKVLANKYIPVNKKFVIDKLKKEQ